MFFFLFAIFPLFVSSLQCVNDNRKGVDWFFIYKINDGLQYAYYDSTSTNLSITPNKLLSGQDNAIGYILNSIWNSTACISCNFIAFNDEAPNIKTKSESYGHTKGVLAYDNHDETGWILIHSWPRFPNFNGPAFVTGASSRYAQTFLCISYSSYTTFNSIAYQIRFNKPKIYRYFTRFPYGTFNNFTQILQKKWLKNTSIFEFDSIHNQQTFKLFSKSSYWDNDLYESLVSPELNQSFIWQTWRRSPNEPTFCKPQYQFDEFNVEYIHLSQTIKWKYTQDHSKIGYGVIQGNNKDDKPWVCVGDINRMFSQYTRGGGTCCFENINLWRILRNAFVVVDSCSV